MALYTPVVQVRYAPQGFFESPKFSACTAAGIFDMRTIEDMYAAGVKAGDFVNVPRTIQVPDFSRVQVGSSTPVSFTAVATNDGKVPILRDISPFYWTRHQLAQTGEDLGRLAGLSVGNKLAKRMLNQMSRGLQAVLNVGAKPHLEDITGAGTKTLNASSIVDAKYRMGDAADTLDTMILSSKAWRSLSKDVLSTYKYAGVWSGQFFESGDLQGIIGIRKFVVTDALLPEGTGTTTTADDYYYSFLLAPGYVYFAYQREPLVDGWNNVTTQDSQLLERVDMDYVIAPKAFAFNVANPTDANFIDPSNWTAAYEDHRNMQVCAVKSNEV